MTTIKYVQGYKKGQGFCRRRGGRQLSSRFNLGGEEALLWLGKGGAGEVLGFDNAS